MTWVEISKFQFGWLYKKNSGFVKLTLKDNTTEFIDGLEYGAFSALIDVLHHGAKYLDKDKKVVSQITELPTKK
jgi:hypothetical protein